MTLQHTPGPWNVAGGELPASVYVADANGTRVCTVRKSERDLDNARLIAAAPEIAAERDRLRALNAELLAALKTLYDWHGLGRPHPHSDARPLYEAAKEQAHAVIAKAEQS